MSEEYEKGYRQAKIDLAKELIRWVQAEHEHHGDYILVELPDMPLEEYNKIEKQVHGFCQHGDRPYVDSISLESMLQNVLFLNGEEII